MKKLLLLLVCFLCSLHSAHAQSTVSTYSNVGSPSVSASNRQQLFPTRTIISGTLDTMSATDSVVFWNSSTLAAKTATLPTCGAGLANSSIDVYDESGNAATYNITFAPVSGTINSASTYVMSTNNASKAFHCDASNNNWVVGISSGGGGGTPGGSSGQIQYNNAGSFGGLSNGAVLNQIQGVKAWPNVRAPLASDGMTVGYSTGMLWSYNGTTWSANNVAAGTANWGITSNNKAAPCDAVSGCLAAYGVYRQRAAYAGNAFQVTRASDSTTYNVPFDVNGMALWSGVDNFCTGTTCGVSVLYDQSGNGYDLVQSTQSKMPQINGESLDIIPGSPRAITCDQIVSATQTMSNSSLPISNIQNVTVMATLAPNFAGGNLNQALFVLGSPTKTVSLIGLNVPGPVTAYVGGNLYPTNKALASNSEIFLFEASSGNMTVTQNNDVSTFSNVLTNTVSTGFSICEDVSDNIPATLNFTSFVVYNSALSAANKTLLTEVEESANAIQPQSNDVAVLIGDSISQGVESGTIGGMNTRWYKQFFGLTAHPFKFYNFGLDSQFLSTFITQISSDLSYAGTKGNTNIVILFGGTNDLAQNNDTGANVYGYFQTGCATIHSLGYKCVVVSTLPRSQAFNSPVTAASFEVQRQILETDLVNGWTSFADGFVDLAGDPVIGPQAAASNNLYFTGGVHPTVLASAYMASVFQRSLTSLTQ